MSLLLSPLKELLSSFFPEEFILDDDWDISRVPLFGGQGERDHCSTVSPLDLLYTRTRYAKGYISPICVVILAEDMYALKICFSVVYTENCCLTY